MHPFFLTCFTPLTILIIFLCILMKSFHVESRHTDTHVAVTSFRTSRQPLLDVTQIYFSLTHSLLAASVAQSTAAGYSNAWQRWIDFAKSLQVSPFPSTHVLCSCILGSVPGLHIITLALLFCTHYFYVSKVKATTIWGYLAGIAHNLKCAGEDATFLVSPQLIMIRAGMRRLQRQTQTCAKGRLPFTLEMIQAFQQAVSMTPTSLANSGLSAAMLLAFSCLLRSSEYIPKLRGKHWLRACDVQFVLDDGTTVCGHTLTKVLLSRVCEVVIHIRSSKTDQSGEGFTFVFSVNVPSSRNLCLALMQWAVQAKLRDRDPFLSARDALGKQVWCISSNNLTKALRSTVMNVFGFSEIQAKRFTPHSLRFGGASTLAAADIPKYQVQLAGRWKSEAFLTYVKASFEIFSKTQEALANPSLLRVRDIKRSLSRKETI